MLEFLGLSSAGYSLTRDVINFFRRRGRKLSPTDILELRQKWKREFEPKMWERHQKEMGLDVIVRDVKRLDAYPNDPSKKGISAWFKAGMMATYHNGLQMGLGWYALKKDKNGWRHADHRNKEAPDETAVLMGNIPYENVEAVDWSGDDFYGNPQLYCHFDASKGQPYEHLYYATKHQNTGGPYFYREIATVSEVVKNTKRAKIKYP